jgi:hypothetical protein
VTKGQERREVALDMGFERRPAEARLLLPGVQALLGLQFALVLARSFDQLPNSSKLIHMAALGLIALTVVLLMAPAALHRASSKGDDAKALQIGSWFVAGAAVPLGLGIGADTYVTIARAMGSARLGLWAAAAIVLLLLVLWFVQPLLWRARRALRR